MVAMTDVVRARSSLTMDERTQTSNLMHILRLEYIGAESDAEQHIPGLIAYLECNHARGVSVVSGQTVPTEHGGVIVATGVSRHEIELISRTAPCVSSGVGRYTVTTFERGRTSATAAH
ncbi:hypothetical protein [Leucobacter aridicollis]|uniref:hypothetical protein n=1 Tax=Leucobacter aridicollis TaxID=283878 RepID=UPI0021682C73|nr:hypothetical protein [Leucobacter aridicollis]MCS3426468.1 uncharacterized protein YciI [Leucobacter aridicollis]